MVKPKSLASFDYLKTHVALDLKQLAYATAEFRLHLGKDPLEVPLQDSALTRGRALLDFMRTPDHPENVRIADYYVSSSAPGWTDLCKRWFKFVSDRVSHMGADRSVGDRKWPGGKTPNRLDRLTRLVIRTMRARVKYVRADCRPLLTLMCQRAETYLANPTPHNFNQMDPSNL
jgi:hypothetical protein